MAGRQTLGAMHGSRLGAVSLSALGLMTCLCLLDRRKRAVGARRRGGGKGGDRGAAARLLDAFNARDEAGYCDIFAPDLIATVPFATGGQPGGDLRQPQTGCSRGPICGSPTPIRTSARSSSRRRPRRRSRHMDAHRPQRRRAGIRRRKPASTSSAGSRKDAGRSPAWPPSPCGQTDCLIDWGQIY